MSQDIVSRQTHKFHFFNLQPRAGVDVGSCKSHIKYTQKELTESPSSYLTRIRIGRVSDVLWLGSPWIRPSVPCNIPPIPSFGSVFQKLLEVSIGIRSRDSISPPPNSLHYYHFASDSLRTYHKRRIRKISDINYNV